MCMSSDIPAEYYIPLWYGWDGTQGYVTGTSQLGQVQTAPTKRVIMACYLCTFQTIMVKKRHYDVILWGDFCSK